MPRGHDRRDTLVSQPEDPLHQLLLLLSKTALADLFSHPTVESFAAQARGTDAAVSRDRALPVRVGGEGPPLFLVHEGGGSVAYAQVLHRHLDPALPVYALPAASGAEPPRTIEGMAARLARMVREVQLTGPYRLAGWSLGGTLAYETAALLMREGEAVEFVGLIDSYHVDGAAAGEAEDADDPALLLWMLRMTGSLNAGVEPAPDGDDLEAFVAEAREKGLLPGHVTAAHARSMRERLRIHRRALRVYAPRPIPVPVHLFPAADDRADPRRGWDALLPGASLRVSPVPGTHFSIMAAENVASLGAALSRELGRAAAEAAEAAEADPGAAALPG